MKLLLFLFGTILGQPDVLCQEECQNVYVECIDECGGDVDCGLDCNRKYVKCEEKCNDVGQSVTILVFNSFVTQRAKLFTWGLEGQRKEEENRLVVFFGPETSADLSCSMILKGTNKAT